MMPPLRLPSSRSVTLTSWPSLASESPDSFFAQIAGLEGDCRATPLLLIIAHIRRPMSLRIRRRGAAVTNM